MQIAHNLTNVTCICCPIGCEIEVAFEQDGSIAEIAGNTCKRGEAYAAAEATSPVRMVTAVIPAAGALEPLSVKTVKPIPKCLMDDVVDCLSNLRVAAPVHTGQTILENVCGTGVDVVATKSIELE